VKISDEMVKAALSTWYRQTSVESAEHAMRAALSAALPLIIEKCAKVADARDGCSDSPRPHPGLTKGEEA
jgi:hypothetical protein